MLNYFLYELRKRRGATIGWGIGLALYVLYVIMLYPSIGAQYAQIDLDSALFQAFIGSDLASMATFAGFYAIYVPSYLPLLLAVYAILNGSGTLAGEEEEGTLELFLTLPLARWQMVLAKALALSLALLVILLVTALGTYLTFVAYQSELNSDVSAMDLVINVLYGWPLVMVFAMMSMFLSAYLPRRRMAAMFMSLFLIVSFLGNNLAGIAEPLQKVQPIFPFYYFNGSEVLASGVDMGDLLVLLGTSLFFYGLAQFSFQRRDVTVGAWPWQRARNKAATQAAGR